VSLNRGDEVADPLALRRGGEDDRHLPRGRLPEVQHLEQVPGDLPGAVAVGLVDHEDVGDLEDAALGHLDHVAESGRERDDGGVGPPGDLDLRLPDAAVSTITTSNPAASRTLTACGVDPSAR
jgi:hypothetical protein